VQTVFLELPYPPVITSAELSSSSLNAVDLAWTPGFDGNSPVLRFTIDFRIIVMGMFAVNNDNNKHIVACSFIDVFFPLV